MSWLNPGALLWAVVILPIVAMYLVRVRLRQVTVSTSLFWNSILQQTQSRSSLRNLSHWLSLVLQLLIAALLILALAEPIIGVRQPARDTLVVLDDSESMSAVVKGVSRWQAAKDRVADLIRQMTPGDRMAILLASDQPRVLCGLTEDTELLRRQLNDLEAANGNGAIDQSIELARQMLSIHSAAPNDAIVVVSDLCFDLPEEMLVSDDVVWTVVGPGADNVGITKFEVRRNPQNLLESVALIEVANFGSHPFSCRLDLDFDGRPADAIPITVPVGQRWSRTVPVGITQRGGQLTARLMNNDVPFIDAQESDNFRSLDLPAVNRVPVVLVTAGNIFLQRVLEANQHVDLRIAPSGDDRKVPGCAPEGGLLVLDGITPEVMPGGQVLMIAPTGPSDLWKLSPVLDQPVVMVQDDASPLLKNVQLADVLMPKAIGILPQADHQILVASQTNAPLFLQFPRDGDSVLVLTVSLLEGDLPLRTAFPILMANIVAECSAASKSASPDRMTGGEGPANDSDLRPGRELASVRKLEESGFNRRAWRMLLIGGALVVVLAEWMLFHRRILG